MSLMAGVWEKLQRAASWCSEAHLGRKNNVSSHVFVSLGSNNIFSFISL